MYNTDELKYIIAGAVIYGRMSAHGTVQNLSDDEISDFLINRVQRYYEVCRGSYSPPFHEFLQEELIKWQEEGEGQIVVK